MTLYQIIQILKQIALTQPNIKSATDGSIYEVMNTNPSVKYNVVHFSQTTHQSDEETDYYGLNIFYVSRLEDSLEDNRLQIQSIGKEVLDNIIRSFCENWGIDFPVITYTPFTQKFNDLCAGCYCNLRLEIPKEIICADDYVGEVIPSDKGIRLQDISITIKENGVRVVTPAAGYDGIGQITINTDVPQELDPHLEDKEVEYTKNGSYGIVPGPGYDGIASVSIDIDVPSRYDEGYDDGAADQKAKLVSTAVTENGTYSREDGYSSIEVNVPQTGQTINNQTKTYPISNIQTQLIYYDKPGDEKWMYSFQNSPITITYDSGYTGLEKLNLDLQIDAYESIELGENQQKAKMVATAITENGEYGRPDGYSAITVNVPAGDDRYEEGYNNGFEDGEAAQKAKLVPTAFTENGIYSAENGYSVVYVTVEQTGYTQQDLDDAYDRGYQDGLEACHSQPVTATSITINVANTITDSGTATTTVNPASATTNLTYTSSDTTKATINGTTGKITVKANGSVTFCVRDSISNLQSCKTVNVVKTQPITAFTYTADTSTIPYSGASRTITYSTSGFNSSSIGFICPDGADYRKNGTTITVIFPYNYYGNQKSYTARLTGYTSDGTYIDTPINYTQAAYPTKGTFTVIYNVTSTSIPTKIMNYNCDQCGAQTSAIFSSATLNNGTVVPLTGDSTNGIRYTFPTKGRVAVNYTLKGAVLGDSSFRGCASVVEVRSMNGIQIIDHHTFCDCTNLTSITMPNTLVRLGGSDPMDGARGGSVFSGCTSLSSVTIPGGFTDLPDACFSGCTNLNISALTIPSNITSIHSGCFAYCKFEGSVTIPSNVLSFNHNVYAGCSALTSIIMERQYPPTVQSYTFGDPDYTFPIYVPSGGVTSYKNQWPSVLRDRIQAKP